MRVSSAGMGTRSASRPRRPRAALLPRERIRLAPPDPHWLARVWPQVNDTELHLRQAPWFAKAWGGLQRLLHA